MRILVDDVNRDTDVGFAEGCSGTISEQITNQDHYDDRLDADDELSKGRLNFPTEQLYGREGDLEVLRGLYGELTEERDRNTSSSGNDLPRAASARVVFVGGYSGVGKSSMVAKFVGEHGGDILCARGQYCKLTSGAAPFSAITDAVGQLTAEITKPERGELLQKIRHELYDCGVDVRLTMTSTFPSTAPLFGHDKGTLEQAPVASNVNEVKEAFKIYMNCVCSCLPNPLILFLDDGQWIDESSFDLLKDALSSNSIHNILFIGTFRSNEVKEDHPFQRLMKEVETSLNSKKRKTASRMELFGLTPDVIGDFISDTLGKSGAAEVSVLTEVVYEKTMGNIFYVKQAMEELARKNALFYDMMMFTWKYNVTKVKMETYLSDDVLDMVKSKIDGLPTKVKTIVMIMSLVPNAVSSSTGTALLEDGGVDKSKAEKLMRYAVKKGILSQQLDDGEHKYAFAHEKIREASYGMIPEGKSRDELLVRVSNVLVDLGKESEHYWALFVAVNHLNSVPPTLISRMELSRLNARVGKLNLDKGAMAAANLNFLTGLACLNDSGEKWNDYQFTLGLLNAVISSEWSMGNHEMSLYHGEDVLKNATSLEDKSTAYLYRMKALGKDENHNYGEAVQEGLKICEIYGLKFRNPVKRFDSIKESVQLKAALCNRPLTALSKLPPTRDSLVFELLKSLQLYSTKSGNKKLGSLVVKRAIRLALQRGISTAFVSILVTHAATMGSSKVKTARKYSLAAENILEVFREDKYLYAETRLLFDQLSFM